VGVARGLREEELLHDEELEPRERRPHVALVRVALRDVLALDPERPDLAAARSLEHLGDREPGLGGRRGSPHRREPRAHLGVGDGLVAGEQVRRAAHVGVALHVVLAAQRQHPSPGPPTLPVSMPRCRP
jgi:hypothetical protein